MNSDNQLLGLELNTALERLAARGITPVVKAVGKERENCIQRVVKVDSMENETLLWTSSFLCLDRE